MDGNFLEQSLFYVSFTKNAHRKFSCKCKMYKIYYVRNNLSKGNERMNETYIYFDYFLSEAEWLNLSSSLIKILSFLKEKCFFTVRYNKYTRILYLCVLFQPCLDFEVSFSNKHKSCTICELKFRINLS